MDCPILVKDKCESKWQTSRPFKKFRTRHFSLFSHCFGLQPRRTRTHWPWRTTSGLAKFLFRRPTFKRPKAASSSDLIYGNPRGHGSWHVFSSSLRGLFANRIDTQDANEATVKRRRRIEQHYQHAHIRIRLRNKVKYGHAFKWKVYAHLGHAHVRGGEPQLQ